MLAPVSCASHRRCRESGGRRSSSPHSSPCPGIVGQTRALPTSACWAGLTGVVGRARTRSGSSSSSLLSPADGTLLSPSSLELSLALLLLKRFITVLGVLASLLGSRPLVAPPRDGVPRAGTLRDGVPRDGVRSYDGLSTFTSRFERGVGSLCDKRSRLSALAHLRAEGRESMGRTRRAGPRSDQNHPRRHLQYR